MEYENKGIHKTDIFEEIMLAHQTNRLKGYGSILLAFTNSIHYLEKNSDLQKNLNGPYENNLYFKMLEKSALNYLRLTRKIEIKSMKMKVMVQTLNSDSVKVYFN